MTPKIPKFIHFICIAPMRYTMFHYLAVISAYFVHKPDVIYMYYDKEQEDNILWEYTKTLVKLEQITPPSVFQGIPVHFPQYKADIIRLEKLYQHGGLYLDLDILSLKPFPSEYYDYDNAMPANDANEDNIEELTSMENSIIMAKPKSDFIKLWYDNLAKNMGEKWAYHAVNLPAQLLQQNRELLYSFKLIDLKKHLMPFHFTEQKPFIFEPNSKNMKNKLDDYFTIMFFQTIQKGLVASIDFFYFYTNDNLFTDIFRPYLGPLSLFKDHIFELAIKHQNDNLFPELVYTFEYLNVGSPKIPDLYILLADYYKSQGNMAEYNAILESLAKLKTLTDDQKDVIAQKTTKQPINDPKLYSDIQSAYHSKSYGKLKTLCNTYIDNILRRIAEKSPELQYVLFYLAFSQHELGDNSDATRNYNTILNSANANSDVYGFAQNNIRFINK